MRHNVPSCEEDLPSASKVACQNANDERPCKKAETDLAWLDEQFWARRLAKCKVELKSPPFRFRCWPPEPLGMKLGNMAHQLQSLEP